MIVDAWEIELSKGKLVSVLVKMKLKFYKRDYTQIYREFKEIKKSRSLKNKQDLNYLLWVSMSFIKN